MSPHKTGALWDRKGIPTVESEQSHVLNNICRDKLGIQGLGILILFIGPLENYANTQEFLIVLKCKLKPNLE
jgi:hypothetical protein